MAYKQRTAGHNPVQVSEEAMWGDRVPAWSDFASTGQADAFAASEVLAAVDVLSEYLQPLLMDAHRVRDVQSAAFCARLLMDLGALRDAVESF